MTACNSRGTFHEHRPSSCTAAARDRRVDRSVAGNSCTIFPCIAAFATMPSNFTRRSDLGGSAGSGELTSLGWVPASARPSSAPWIACGLDFFGAEQAVFGSDCPFDPEGGPLFIREITAAIDALEIPEADRRKIYEANIRRLARHRLRG